MQAAAETSEPSVQPHLQTVEQFVFQQIQRQLDALCRPVAILELLSNESMQQRRLARLRCTHHHYFV